MKTISAISACTNDWSLAEWRKANPNLSHLPAPGYIKQVGSNGEVTFIKDPAPDSMAEPSLLCEIKLLLASAAGTFALAVITLLIYGVPFKEIISGLFGQ